MIRAIRLLAGAIFRLVCTRRRLLLENLALRQQLTVLKRKHPRPRITAFDRLFWILARRPLSGWKRKRKKDKTKPLDLPEDEAIAQYLTTPKSIREFESITDLAKYFNISRMTVHRRTKDLDVLQRVEWLLTHHKLAGDLVARLRWKRIVAGQMKAAAAGDTKAAQFCKEVAWPEEPPPVDIWKT